MFDTEKPRVDAQDRGTLVAIVPLAAPVAHGEAVRLALAWLADYKHITQAEYARSLEIFLAAQPEDCRDGKRSEQQPGSADKQS